MIFFIKSKPRLNLVASSNSYDDVPLLGSRPARAWRARAGHTSHGHSSS
jgi:hypothetical protein